MKLNKFLENLNELVKTNPEFLELEVITSKDDEGNGYDKVYYSPSIGNFDDYEFKQEVEFDDYELTKKDINAICVN
jgi:hypothetical protein